MSPACRTPNAAIPPHSPAATTAHRPRRWLQRRPTLHSPRSRPRPAHAAANDGPHPSTTRPNQPRLRPPAHTQPPNGGFCTTRRIATACRRRVAPLMLQFPPLTREGTTATPPSAPPSALAGTSVAPPRPAAVPPAQRLHSPATASGQSVARHHRRSLRTPPAIQSKRNQTNSIRSNCHKLILNALEFIHEPRRWGHRSPLHPRNC